MQLDISPNSAVSTFAGGLTTKQDLGNTYNSNTKYTFGIIPSVAYVPLTTQTSGTYNGKVYGEAWLPRNATVRDIRFYVTGGGLNANNDFTSIAYNGSNQYVASSAAGLFYSADGITFTKCTGGTTVSFNKVVFSNSIYMAVSNGAGVWTSADGVTFTNSASQPTATFTDVVFQTVSATATWVFTHGVNSGLYYSTNNGTALTQCTGATTGKFNRVIFGGTNFVACSNTAGIYASTDGVTFAQATGGTTLGFTDVVYNGSNLFVATAAGGGGVWSSANATTWTQRILTGSFAAVDFGNSVYVAVSSASGGVYSSANGTTWTVTNLTTGSYKDVAYGSSGWSIASADGLGLYYASTAGVSYSLSNITSGSFNHVMVVNSRYYALTSDNNGMYYATTPSSFSSAVLAANAIGSSQISIAVDGETIPTLGNVLSNYSITASRNGALQVVDMNSVLNFNLIRLVDYNSILYFVSDASFTIATGSSLYMEVSYYFTNDQ